MQKASQGNEGRGVKVSGLRLRRTAKKQSEDCTVVNEAADRSFHELGVSC